MLKDRWVQLGAVLVASAGLAGSVFFTTQLASSIGRNQLVYADRAEDGDPPEVGLGIALGAFRGFFVNMLWYQANEAKEAGNYYQAIDLAKTITRLQPRFPRVWAFHAWNLAYNISVLTQTAPERWNWVNSGIRLLRNQGIPANPNDLMIHRELAWILLHKVQGVMDDANQFYKRRFAEEWTIVLGPPRPANPGKREDGKMATREENVADAVELLTRVATAPDTLEEVIAKLPEAAAVIERVKAAGGDLTTATGRFEFLRRVELNRSLGRLRASLNKIGIELGSDELLNVLADQSAVPVFQVLVPHVRKRVLIDDYHMEPDRMIRYNQRYGPLDWRHPAAHALYWASRGVDEALGRVDDRTRKDFDFLNTDRLVAHAAQELYRTGTIIYDITSPENFLAMPNPDWIPVYRDILQQLIDREAMQLATVGADVKSRPYNMYQAGYENFMRDAITFLYRRGQLDLAREYQGILRTDVKQGRLNWNDSERIEEIDLPLEKFVLAQLKDRVDTPYLAVSEVTGALQGAFVGGLLSGNAELFRTQFEYARMFHGQFMQNMVRTTQVDERNLRLETMDRDFPMYAGKVFAAMIGAVGVVEGSIMYNRAPRELQLAAYYLLSREVKPSFDATDSADDGSTASAQSGSAAAAGPDGAPVSRFDLWFPKPEGFDAFMAERQAIEARREADRAQTEMDAKK
jgi:hypothetical protein